MPIDTSGIVYPLDTTGDAVTNIVRDEQHRLTPTNHRDFHFIVPRVGPFYAKNFVVEHRDLTNNVRTLVEGVDFYFTHQFIGASRATALPIYGSISFLNLQLTGTITIKRYNTIGGDWAINETKALEIMADRIHNPRITAWEQVSGKPNIFPPVPHQWNLVDMVGAKDVVTAINRIADAINISLTNGFQAHVLNRNAHNTRPSDIGTLTTEEIEAKIARIGVTNKVGLKFFVGGRN